VPERHRCCGKNDECGTAYIGGDSKRRLPQDALIKPVQLDEGRLAIISLQAFSIVLRFSGPLSADQELQY